MKNNMLKSILNFLKETRLKLQQLTLPERLQLLQKTLKHAAAGENEEWTSLYPSFSETAMKEGFPKVAAAFQNILQK